MSWLAKRRQARDRAAVLERIAASTFSMEVNGENVIGPVTLESLYLTSKYGGETGGAMFVTAALIEIRVKAGA